MHKDHTIFTVTTLICLKLFVIMTSMGYNLLYYYSVSSRAPYIPKTFAIHSFFQMNNPFNNRESILDFVFSCNELLTIETSIEPTVTLQIVITQLLLSPYIAGHLYVVPIVHIHFLIFKKPIFKKSLIF